MDYDTFIQTLASLGIEVTNSEKSIVKEGKFIAYKYRLQVLKPLKGNKYNAKYPAIMSVIFSITDGTLIEREMINSDLELAGIDYRF